MSKDKTTTKQIVLTIKHLTVMDDTIKLTQAKVFAANIKSIILNYCDTENEDIKDIYNLANNILNIDNI